MTSPEISPLSPPRPRAALVVATLGALLVAAVLLSGACRMPGATAPASASDELAKLGRLVDASGPVLLVARVGCGAAHTHADEVLCDGVVDALEEGVSLAAVVVRQGEACRASSDQACLAAFIATARDKLPELRRLLEQAKGPTSTAASSAPAAHAAPSAAPAGSP